MHLARPRRKQPVSRHGKEDTRLAKQHNDHGAAESTNSAELHHHASPAHAGNVDADGDGIRDVKIGVLHQAGKNGGY